MFRLLDRLWRRSRLTAELPLTRTRILVAGDSHCRFWAGYDTLLDRRSIFQGIDVLSVGPATAYNASARRSRSNAQAKIVAQLSANPDRYGGIILCFGEIDCRLHILKHALISDITIDEAVARVVPRYMELVDHLQHKYGLPVLLWGPIASAPDNGDGYNPLYPSVGSTIERNQATLSFAAAVRDEAGKRKGVAQFDILDSMIDEYLGTRSNTLFDGCHLGSNSLIQAIPLLRRILEQLQLERLSPALERWPQLTSRRGLRNIADDCVYTISTERPGVPTHRFAGDPTAGAKFHTLLEPCPWIMFDFGSAYLLDEIVVYNRSVECQERARRLEVSASLDGVHFRVLYQPAEPVHFGGVVEGTPCRVKVPAQTLARYVRLALREETYFHLDFVQVFAFSFRANAVPSSQQVM